MQSIRKWSRFVAILAMWGIWNSAMGVDPIPQKGKLKRPKNVVLMIGDGMGLAQLCAAYAANGNFLEIFSMFKVMGLSLTASASDWITDSAAGATAFSIGEKTHNGMLGLDADSTRKITLVEEAIDKGLGTGLVATCDITHATPAAFYAHRVSREMHPEIALDFYRSNIHLTFGGGLPWFNGDSLNQFGFQYHISKEPWKLSHTYSSEKNIKELYFYDSALHVPKMSESRGEWLPRVSEMAVNKLDSKFKKGFFLMIEGSQIDWGGHANDSDYVIRETIDFSQAVSKVLKWAMNDGETLVIVTADHETGGLSLPGFDSTQSRPYMQFVNTHHSGIAVPVFAFGPGAEQFSGVYENTEIYHKIRLLWRWK